MEEKIFEEMKYLVSYPEGFSENKKYPLMIFLHGRGARGETTERLHNYSCIADLNSVETRYCCQSVLLSRRTLATIHTSPSMLNTPSVSLKKIAV